VRIAAVLAWLTRISRVTGADTVPLWHRAAGGQDSDWHSVAFGATVRRL